MRVAWLLLPALLLASASALPAAEPAETGEQAEAPAQAEDARSRLERMRGTGSRAGFRNDTRPAGKLAGKGQQRVVTREEGDVPARPTRWRDDTVGGRTVHQVRFRREGEPEEDDGRP